MLNKYDTQCCAVFGEHFSSHQLSSDHCAKMALLIDGGIVYLYCKSLCVLLFLVLVCWFLACITPICLFYLPQCLQNHQKVINTLLSICVKILCTTALNHASVIGHPLGGNPRQIQLPMGTFRGVWTIILPRRWVKWGRFGFRKLFLHPGGNRGLRKRNRSLSSCLTSIVGRPLYRRTRAHFLVENCGVRKAVSSGIVM